MTFVDALQYLNLLGLPILAYVIKIENRVTRLEALRESDIFHRNNRKSSNEN